VVAVSFVLPAFLAFGKADFLPDAPLQWAVLVFLGLVSTALGMYWWNKGACLVTGGTLAVMNNLHVPVGLLLNLLIWNQHEPLGRLLLGGLVILFAVWLSRLDRRAATV
jgi:drug/metabolite transporter (DMT)-like permease